ncbi:hypothetical protein [Flavobacterium sp.]|uniref:hypothetical protein n=1 Tax=Flavobacterium sp. TaxID=239 RepID=UPI003B9C2D94
MLRLFTLLIILGFTTSCTQKAKTERAAAFKVDESENFLKLFPEIAPRNLHVYSPRIDTTGYSDKYTGVKIDRSYYKFLACDNTINPAEIDTSYHYFACFRFKLSENQTGLIIRRLSQYSETAIDLYTWDNSKKKVINIINLADAFGDGGWYFVQDAWIDYVNADKFLDLVIIKKEYNEGADDTSPGTQSDTSFVFLGNNKTFKKSNLKLERSKYHLKYWSE